MKYANKKDIVNLIDKSAEELHLKINMHYHLMIAMLEQRPDNGNMKELFLPSCYQKESRLKAAIEETIDVLEQTRRAFKSKKLEILRKKLTQVLIKSG